MYPPFWVISEHSDTKSDPAGNSSRFVVHPIQGVWASRCGCDTLKIFLWEYERMPKVSVEIPQELLDDLDGHVGEEGKFVNRSDAVRASVRKTLDMLDKIDERHGRIDSEENDWPVLTNNRRQHSLLLVKSRDTPAGCILTSTSRSWKSNTLLWRRSLILLSRTRSEC